VFGNGRLLHIEKRSHLFLRQPHRVLFQAHFDGAVFGLIDADLVHGVFLSSAIEGLVQQVFFSVSKFLKACSNIRGARYTGMIKVDNLTGLGFVGYVPV